MERTAAQALRMYMRTYSLFKSGRLSTNIKLTIYKAHIRSVMTSACPTWYYAADAHLLKSQRLQNKVLRATGNLYRCTQVHELYVTFKIPFVYAYMTKLCRIHAEFILNHVNPNVRCTGEEEARHRKYRRLKVGDSQAYDRSADYLQFQSH
jgi:hypothetical protein